MCRSSFLGLNLALALSVLSFGASSESSPVSADGRKLVEHMMANDFAAVYARFNAPMQAALPEAESWKMPIARPKKAFGGNWKKSLEVRVVHHKAADTAVVTCQCPKGKLDVEISINRQGQIGGLFFKPYKVPESAFGPPPYSHSDSFTEKPFRIGEGADGLPGTLTTPKDIPPGGCPGVVLVQGSGPTDRDETVDAYKPFRDLAWGLATQGIVVLRYDKRTLVHPD